MRGPAEGLTDSRHAKWVSLSLSPVSSTEMCFALLAARLVSSPVMDLFSVKGVFFFFFVVAVVVVEEEENQVHRGSARGDGCPILRF